MAQNSSYSQMSEKLGLKATKDKSQMNTEKNAACEPREDLPDNQPNMAQTLAAFLNPQLSNIKKPQ